MACGCIAHMNAKLEPLNGKISETLVFGSDGNPGFTCVLIDVVKIQPRGKRPPVAMPTFCPFCGAPYRSVKVDPTVRGGSIQAHLDYERVRKIWDDALSICEATCRELTTENAALRSQPASREQG